MSQNHDAPVAISPKRSRSRKRWWWLFFLLIVIVGGYFVFHERPETGSTGTLFAARRGPLEVTVLAGGSVEARESQIVSSEVHGETKILSIVEDGYTVTPEDVQNKKLLVELNAKDLEDKKLTQDLEFENAQADNIQAKKEYEMQINQNLSDITTAALTAKFAFMDFEKYMGITAGKEILSQIGLTREDLNEMTRLVQLAVTTANDAKSVPVPPAGEPEKTPPSLPVSGEKSDKPEKTELNGNVSEAPSDKAESSSAAPEAKPAKTDSGDAAPEAKPEEKKEAPAPPVAPPVVAKPTPPALPESILPEVKPHAGIDWTKYAKIEALGDGEARQMLRKLESTANLSDGTMKLAETQFEGTKRLAAKEFVTKNELETEKLKVQGNKISKESAETEQKLFLDYTFPKEAEKRLSDYEESVRKLLRAAQLAESKLAQVRARRNSAEARYSVQSRHRVELTEQIEKCKIFAKVPGLVAYAGQDDWRGMSRIEVGATVRQQQQIITIPDMSQMVVKIKVPEASVRSVVKGQKARVSIDAFPDQALTGEVLKIGVLPDSQNRWMNPDVKVYETTITIDGTQDWLRPGMSAQVEVIIKKLPDVLYVPIQAVVPKDGQRVVYVSRLSGKETRPVEVGDFNEQFIEIKTGLSEGEQVLLRAPMSPDSADKKSVDKKKDKEKDGDESKDKKDQGESPKRDVSQSESSKSDAPNSASPKGEAPVKPASGKGEDKDEKKSKDGARTG